jgi:Cupin domain
VIEGDLRFSLDGELHSATTGSFVFVPRRAPHCFQNIGAEPAGLLVLFTPAGIERFFDRFATFPAGRLDPESFRTAGAEAGMDVVGPPLAVSHPA